MSGTGQCNYYAELLPINHVLRINSFLECILTKLYHIDLRIEDNSRTIVKNIKDLPAALRQEQFRVHDKALKSARADQVNAQMAAIMQRRRIQRKQVFF